MIIECEALYGEFEINQLVIYNYKTKIAPPVFCWKCAIVDIGQQKYLFPLVTVKTVFRIRIFFQNNYILILLMNI